MSVDRNESYFLDSEFDRPDIRRLSGSSILFYLTAESFGLKVTEQQRFKWSTLHGLAYCIDQHVDVERGEVTGFMEAIIAGSKFPYVEPETQERAQELFSGLTTHEQDDFLRNLANVDELVDEQVLNTSPKRLVGIRIDEADIYARLLSLPADKTNSVSDVARFNGWLQSFSRSGYMWDTFLDLKSDFEDGSSGVNPSLLAGAVVSTVAIRESIVAVQRTPIDVLHKAIGVGVNYLILNKKPDFST